MRRAVTLRQLLLRLCLFVAVPLALLAIVSTSHGVLRERARFDAQIMATARALAIAVDGEVAQLALRAETLANATSLAEGDLARFRERAGRDLGRGMRVLVLRPTGDILAEAANDPAGAPAGVPPRGLFDAALAQPGPWISDYFTTSAQQPVIAATRRLSVAGEEGVLAVMVRSTALGEVLRRQRLGEGWVAAVVDRTGRVVARTRAEQEFLGARARQWTLDVLNGPGEGVNRGIVTHDGMRSVTAASRAPVSGFAVALAAPAPPMLADLLAVLAVPLVVGAVLFGFGLFVARQLARRLMDGLAGLLPGASGPPSGVLEFDNAARRLREAEASSADALRRIAESEARYRIATEAFAGGVYECSPFENTVLRSPGMLRILGETTHEPHRDWWFSRVHPDDLPMLLAAYARVKSGAEEQFEVEYRIRHKDGRWIWIWHRSVAWRDEAGRAVRMIGSFLDVTARREANEAQALLAREMEHRVKNAFSLVSSIVGLTAATHPDAADYAADLRQRLAALTAAHDLVWRGAEGASLHMLLARLVAPHGGREDLRVRITGEDVPLLAAAVPHLGLILHEWLTNAAKHGALSSLGGRLSIATRREGDALVLEWREENGPRVEGPPESRGFGSTLAAATVGHRLGGSVDEDWAPEGLRMTLRMAAERVTDRT